MTNLVAEKYILDFIPSWYMSSIAKRNELNPWTKGSLYNFSVPRSRLICSVLSHIISKYIIINRWHIDIFSFSGLHFTRKAHANAENILYSHIFGSEESYDSPDPLPVLSSWFQIFLSMDCLSNLKIEGAQTLSSFVRFTTNLDIDGATR